LWRRVLNTVATSEIVSIVRAYDRLFKSRGDQRRILRELAAMLA